MWDSSTATYNSNIPQAMQKEDLPDHDVEVCRQYMETGERYPRPLKEEALVDVSPKPDEEKSEEPIPEVTQTMFAGHVKFDKGWTRRSWEG